MRPLHLYDLDTAVRAALMLPRAARRGFLEKAVMRAQVADRFRKRLGRAHPDFGDGTLAGAVGWRQKASTAHLDKDYRQCLGLLLSVLAVPPGDQSA